MLRLLNLSSTFPFTSSHLFSFRSIRVSLSVFIFYLFPSICVCVHVCLCVRARVFFLPFLSSIHITLSLTLSQPVVVKRVSNVERNVHGRYADYANRWKELCHNTATQRFAPGVRAVATFEIIPYPL